MKTLATPKKRRAARRVLTLRGQSVIGLLVTMAILAILAAIIIPKYIGHNEYSATGQVQGEASAIDSANDVACTEYMSQVAEASNMYRQANNSRPPDLKSLKPYGVTDEMINTPNCNFGLPKDASQPQAAAAPGAPTGVTTIQSTPHVSWQQSPGQPQPQAASQPSPYAQPDQNPDAAGANQASQAARDGIPMAGGQ